MHIVFARTCPEGCRVSEERVRKGAEKLSKGVAAKQQGRLDGFFTVTPKLKETGKGKAKDDKRKKATKRKVS